MRATFRVLLPLLLLPCLAGAAAAAEPADRARIAERCPAAASFVTPPRPLERLAAAVREGGPVRILAVGSGTTSGQDESGPAAYPRRMEDALRQDLQVPIALTVKGARGLTAAEMLRLIAAALAEQPAALVIWQTGTVEALAGTPPAALEATLREGAAKVQAAGADLVLVGPMFSRQLLDHARLEPVTAALAAVADAPGRALFDRLTLTRSWVEQGRIDLAHAATREERQAALELMHACVGDALARFVARGAGR